MRLMRSVAGRLVLLSAIFVVVPVIVYQQFRAADAEKTQLLIDALRDRGQAMVFGLKPVLQGLTPQTLNELENALSSYEELDVNLRILLRPVVVADPSDFYYVASVPEAAQDYLDRDLAEVKAQGVLDQFGESCARDTTISRRHVNPQGEIELLTSITPVQSPSGCWIVIVSNPATAIGPAGLDEPYWSRVPVRLSFAIYVGMAIVALFLLIDVRRNLYQFVRLAKRLRRHAGTGGSFQEANRIPELAGVAVEFDGMVQSLSQSADAIRQTAEETSHALKSPIGVLVQALESLKRSLPAGEERGHKAVERMELAIERLNRLVERNRHLEEWAAESLVPTFEPLDLNALVADFVEDKRFDETVPIEFTAGAGPVRIRGNPRLIGSSLDNMVDNAISFTPPGGRVFVSIARHGAFADVAVADDGPGVDPADLECIFERSYSRRVRSSVVGHYGLGLWIVRRNADSHNGVAWAENRREGGFRVTIRLPLDS